MLATLTVTGRAPAIVAQRLRKGSWGSTPGAARLIGDAVKAARRLFGADRTVLVRMDSPFFGGPSVRAVLAGGADVSVTVRLTATIKTAIASVEDAAWTTIEYTDAIRDDTTGSWISRAEAAEIRFAASQRCTSSLLVSEDGSVPLPQRDEHLCRPGCQPLVPLLSLCSQLRLSIERSAARRAA